MVRVGNGAFGAALPRRADLGTHNPHVLVTRVAKHDSAPASEACLAHVLDPAGVPRPAGCAPPGWPT